MTAPAPSRSTRLRRAPSPYEAYLALPDEGRVVEWNDGEIIYHMPPTLPHQDLTVFLAALLRAYAHTLAVGRVIAAPFEVKLWPGGPSREPDVFFVGRRNLSRLDERRLNGPPDLVVEVVSPSTAVLDRAEKFLEYERAGVEEYWIIDPRPRQQQADFYTIGPDGRFAPAPVDDAGVYTSTVLPGFRLRLAWLWRPERVGVERAVAESRADAPDLSDDLRALYRRLLELLPEDE